MINVFSLCVYLKNMNFMNFDYDYAIGISCLYKNGKVINIYFQAFSNLHDYNVFARSATLYMNTYNPLTI